jgi:large subunit ribosomal protein L23
MNTNPQYVVWKPVITEEATIRARSNNQYVFKVDPRANKNQIREAIERIFPNVKVVRVNTMKYEGKMSGHRGRSLPGRRKSWKKAIITLRAGDSIELF